MDRINITLLFIGWMAYWLSMAKLAFNSKAVPFHPGTFAEENFYDMTLSLLNCLAIVISKNQLSFEVVDTTKPVLVLMAGFTSSVIINQAIKHLFNGAGSR